MTDINLDKATILGLDLSLNHWALVALKRHGEIARVYYASNVLKHHTKASFNPDWISHRIPKKSKGEDKWQYTARRRHYHNCAIGILLSAFRSHCGEVYLNVEHYAYGTTTNSAYEIGELGGVVRECAWNADISLRQTDPQSLKMFATKGGVGKDIMIEMAKHRGLRVPAHLIGTDIEGDVADAWWLAEMLRTELRLRTGDMLMTDLDQHQLRAFNRCTKTFPTSLLSRGFIERTATK